MSGLLAALERIESGRSTRSYAPPARPQPASPPQRDEPPQPRQLPLALVVPEPPPTTVFAAADRETVPLARAPRRTRFTAAAAALADAFTTPAVVALVGCELSIAGADIAAGLSEALAFLGVGPVETFGPGALDPTAGHDLDLPALRARAPLVLVHLSAEQATARFAALAQLDGVLMLVETQQTSTRAAGVTAAALRMQGVAVPGVLVVQ